MYTIALLDDKEQQLDAVEAEVRGFFEGLPVAVERFGEADEFLSRVESDGSRFDIALVDIVLDNERENGVALAKRLLRHNEDCQIIFVSGYPEYWQDAYSVPHLWFVQKAEIERSLPQALERAKENCDRIRTRKTELRLSKGTAVLPNKEILYLERELRITKVVTANGALETGEKLDSLLDRIGFGFVRCHRSFAVNIDHVRGFAKQSIKLTDGSQIPVSRAYRSAVAEQLSRFFAFSPHGGGRLDV